MIWYQPLLLVLRHRGLISADDFDKSDPVDDLVKTGKVTLVPQEHVRKFPIISYEMR